MGPPYRMRIACLILSVLVVLGHAISTSGQAKFDKVKPGQRVERLGDEIMVAGQLFHTGTPVVLWTDPGGYDAYRVERRFVPMEQAGWAATTQSSKAWAGRTPNRYNVREHVLTTQEAEKVRGGGWDLGMLQEKVDQFVLHYDVCGVSQQCFNVLHDGRGLSVHFMLDIDGTIYQTLDLKERAWHATVSNSRSIGIEIANMGAYTANEFDPFRQWYAKDESGRWRITVPARFGDGGVRTPNFVGRPDRNKLIWGEVQGHRRRQWDFTPQQYEALIKLTATLCTVFPKIRCDYPRDEKGRLVLAALSEEELAKFQGVLGHYHVQADKSDPGPAMQWDRVIEGARKLMDPKLVPRPSGTTRPMPQPAVEEEEASVPVREEAAPAREEIWKRLR